MFALIDMEAEEYQEYFVWENDVAKVVIPFIKNKFTLARKLHKFLCLERATIA